MATPLCPVIILHIFLLSDEQIKREDELVNYFHARMQFNDALRTHIEYLPLQPLALPPAVGNETPSVINAYARELKTIEKVFLVSFSSLTKKIF